MTYLLFSSFYTLPEQHSLNVSLNFRAHIFLAFSGHKTLIKLLFHDMLRGRLFPTTYSSNNNKKESEKKLYNCLEKVHIHMYILNSQLICTYLYKEKRDKTNDIKNLCWEYELIKIYCLSTLRTGFFTFGSLFLQRYSSVSVYVSVC